MKAIASCECGQLRIQISKPPVMQLVCHCKDCQTFSGGPYVRGAFFTKESCSVTGASSDESLVGGTGAAKHHHCCSSCGAPLYVVVDALNGAIAIAAERISSFEFQPDAHVWTSQKAADSVVPPDILQSAEGPPDQIVARAVSIFWK